VLKSTICTAGQVDTTCNFYENIAVVYGLEKAQHCFVRMRDGTIIGDSENSSILETLRKAARRDHLASTVSNHTKLSQGRSILRTISQNHWIPAMGEMRCKSFHIQSKSAATGISTPWCTFYMYGGLQKAETRCRRIGKQGVRLHSNCTTPRLYKEVIGACWEQCISCACVLRTDCHANSYNPTKIPGIDIRPDNWLKSLALIWANSQSLCQTSCCDKRHLPHLYRQRPFLPTRRLYFSHRHRTRVHIPTTQCTLRAICRVIDIALLCPSSHT